MRKNQRKFIKLLANAFKASPDSRITQTLFNLGVNEVDKNPPSMWRDNFNDKDRDVIDRMRKGFKCIVKLEESKSRLKDQIK